MEMTAKKPLAEMTDEHFEQLKADETTAFKAFQETSNQLFFNLYRKLRNMRKQAEKARG